MRELGPALILGLLGLSACAGDPRGLEQPLCTSEVDGRSLVVSAGQLRLRLEGRDKQGWLVVEGERCPPSGGECQRVVQLLALVRGEFVLPALMVEDGSCVGAAEFVLVERARVEIGRGMQREFEIVRSLVFDKDGAPLLREHLAIHDIDPRFGGAPPKLVRESERDRLLRYEAGALRTSASLWAEVRSEFMTELAPKRPRYGR